MTGVTRKFKHLKWAHRILARLVLVMSDPEKLKAALEKMTPEEVDLEIASAWKSYIGVLTEIKNKNAASPARRKVEIAAPDLETRNLRYARLPLPDIILEHLESCKEPQTCKQIVATFVKAGREFETDKPVRAVRATLKKLMSKNNDIFQVGWAKWHLRSKYKNNKAKLERLLSTSDKANSGTGGRSNKEHGRRTAEGIAKRRSEGLAKWGREKKATPEVVERAKEMMRNGMTLRETCRTLDVAIPTLYQYGLRQRALKKEGKKLKELPLGDHQEGNNVVKFAKS